MALFLRRWRKQHRIEGREPASWDNNHQDDYCVVDDVRIGRVTRRENEPLKGYWNWHFHLYGHRQGLQLNGTAPTLEEAKAAIKADYEKWLALNCPIRPV
jgi:hypothetical protein